MESRPDFSGRAFFISFPKEVSRAGAANPSVRKIQTALAPPAPEKGVGGRGGNSSVRKIQTALAPPAPERGVEGRGQRIPRLHNTTTGKAFRLSLPLGAENGIRTRVSRERFRDCLSTPPAPERGVEGRGRRIPPSAKFKTTGRTFWLSLLSWSGKRDSNPRPSAWEADALPTELFPHYGVQRYSEFLN